MTRHRARSPAAIATAALWALGCQSPSTAHDANAHPPRGTGDAGALLDASASVIPAEDASSPAGAPVDAPDASVPAPESPFCRAIREERGRVLGGLGSDDASSFQSLFPVLGTCIGAADSHWAFALERAVYGNSAYGQRELRVRWALVHSGSSEVRIHLAAPKAFTPEDKMPDTTTEEFNLRSDIDSGTVFGTPVLFDWSGDKEPEIVIRQSLGVHEGGNWDHGRIWSFARGKIALYEPARALSVVDVEDVDNDGRPDVWTHGPYSLHAQYVGSGFDYAMTGPRILAHSVPDGGFAMSDPVATAATEKNCGGATDPFVGKIQSGPSTPDQEEIAVRVACARLRGKSAAQVVARIDRECRGASRLLQSPCDAAPKWKRFALLPPPTRIPNGHQ